MPFEKCERCRGDHSALTHRPDCPYAVEVVGAHRRFVTYAVEIANTMGCPNDFSTTTVDLIVRKAVAFYLKNVIDGINCAVEKFVLERYRR